MDRARTGLVISLAFAVLALAAAYVMQYGFDLQPCRLCFWQRYPYMAVIVVAGIGLAAGGMRWALALVALLFAVGAGIALYHTGIEQGLFALPAGCAAGPTLTMEAMMQSLGSSPPSCDRPAVVWLGLSLSAWNALAATSMAALALAIWRRSGR